VADDGCTAQDVYDLHVLMKRAVMDEFGVEIFTEVRFVGDFQSP